MYGHVFCIGDAESSTQKETIMRRVRSIIRQEESRKVPNTETSFFTPLTGLSGVEDAGDIARLLDDALSDAPVHQLRQLCASTSSSSK